MIRHPALKFLSPAALLLWAAGGPWAKGQVPDDEAKAHHRTAADFRHALTGRQNFFKGMDAIAGPPALPDQLLAPGPPPEPRKLGDPVTTANEILGRDTWMLWCAGNEGFWDWLAGYSSGVIDLLKLVDTRNRSTRFLTAGLINEPGMRQAAHADKNGLWLDIPATDGKPASAIPEAIYGRSSGVIGLRLFPNPQFPKAKARWDARRYYNDPGYYNDPKLVRPYRVGMSCAFCHASFHPLNPPANVAEPRWENLSGNIGAQYLRVRAVFGNLLPKNDFLWHLLDSQPPGTSDTSLIASDNLNNPNAMNAIFDLPQRIVRSFVNPPEPLSSESLTQPAVWGNPAESLPAGLANAPVWLAAPAHKTIAYQGKTADKVPKVLWDAFEQAGLLDRLKDSNTASGAEPRFVPRILFDGADSIGAWGALARVFLNIGCFGEQWRTLHTPLIGLTPQRPFHIKDLTGHSVYWEATQERIAPLRDYFLKITPPMPLLAAPGAKDRVDLTKLALGRKVFANHCIVCHSSIQPENDPALDAGDALKMKRQMLFQQWAQAGEYWDHNPGRWVQDDDYVAWAEAVVERPGFWKDNYLSTDYRMPVTTVGTNPARALATNGLGGHMWSDFTSQGFKQLPSIGPLKYFNPYPEPGKDGEASFTPRHQAPKGSPAGGGGPGFYRPPSLISIWATAPFLHNNSLGLFNGDPSVEGRLAAFDDAIRKMLWPAKRMEGSSYNEATPERLQQDHGLIWRTTEVTYLSFGDTHIGPIPKGTPVSLLANLNPEADPQELKKALDITLETLASIAAQHLSEPDAHKLLRERVAPALMGVSKCPDFVMDKGHYLPWFSTMTDEDKEALIELLKTF